jgi:hypothetical protein
MKRAIKFFAFGIGLGIFAMILDLPGFIRSQANSGQSISPRPYLAEDFRGFEWGVKSGEVYEQETLELAFEDGVKGMAYRGTFSTYEAFVYYAFAPDAPDFVTGGAYRIRDTESYMTDFEAIGQLLRDTYGEPEVIEEWKEGVSPDSYGKSLQNKELAIWRKELVIKEVWDTGRTVITHRISRGSGDPFRVSRLDKSKPTLSEHVIEFRMQDGLLSEDYPTTS